MYLCWWWWKSVIIRYKIIIEICIDSIKINLPEYCGGEYIVWVCGCGYVYAAWGIKDCCPFEVSFDGRIIGRYCWVYDEKRK